MAEEIAWAGEWKGSKRGNLNREALKAWLKARARLLIEG
jgi:hypothetical protein